MTGSSWCWPRSRWQRIVEPRNFVVLTTQGAGGSWLMEKINNIRGVQGHMELFYNDFRRAPARAGCNDFPRFVEIGSRFGHGCRPDSLFGYLDQFYSRPAASGFKLMYSQLREYPEILLYLVTRRLAVLHLVSNNPRESKTEQKLSPHMQHFNTDIDFTRHVPVIETQAMTARIRRRERKQSVMGKVLKVLPVPVLELSYEELRSGPSAFVPLCNFLGVNSDRAAEGIRSESPVSRGRADLLVRRQEGFSADERRTGPRRLR